MTTNKPQWDIKFIPNGRGKAQCAPDPAYPNGQTYNMVKDATKPSCQTALPYPAPECGMWSVICKKCGMNILVTAVGRPDDPISVRVNCKRIVQ
jgi:hypothetical protein